MIFGVAVLLGAISYFVIGVRRLHDMDKSGWWILFLLVPGLNAVLLLVLLFRRGTAGPNRFGDNPRAASAG